MTFTPQARKAVKHTVKLKIGIQGPSGSGKTLGALSLAKGLVPGGKILLVDTEHESASLYADRYEFDTIPLQPPFLSENYEACIDYAVKNGYDVLVIDSITHQWDGDGGILRRKEAVDDRGGNSFTNWKPFTSEHNQFKEKIIQAPICIIATMRSKTEYIMEANDKGKQQPKKVGTAPIQREGMEYEFSLVFDVQMDHRGKASKNRTGLFDGNLVNLCDPKTAEALVSWMSSGDPAPLPAATPAQAPATSEKAQADDTVLAGTISDLKPGDKGGMWMRISGHGSGVLFPNTVKPTMMLVDGMEVEFKVQRCISKGNKKKFYRVESMLYPLPDTTVITDADLPEGFGEPITKQVTPNPDVNDANEEPLPF